MVTKSCTGNNCRDPWSALQPPNATQPVTSLTQALNPAYDSFFASIPKIHFNTCMQYQDEKNEMPFYPIGAEDGLGKQYRSPTDNFITTEPNGTAVPPNAELQGGWEQRNVTLAEILANSRPLTDAELGFGNTTGDIWGGGPEIMD